MTGPPTGLQVFYHSIDAVCITQFDLKHPIALVILKHVPQTAKLVDSRNSHSGAGQAEEKVEPSGPDELEREENIAPSFLSPGQGSYLTARQ